MKVKHKANILFLAVMGVSLNAHALSGVSDRVIAKQRKMLAKNTAGQGFGPQSPRDINVATGTNPITFSAAPAYTKMNLCNIHFHKNAEHRGGDFTSYAGNGNGKGYLSGYKFDGRLSESDLAPVGKPVCKGKYGGLKPGDTIEVHYVHSSAKVTPGPTLGACLSPANKNPQLRVEAQVFVLANDKNATDFRMLTQHSMQNGVHQAYNLPNNTGTPVQYAGSTTGPSYNEKGSPFQVSWSVRPKVIKLDINTVGKWCEGNTFKEDHAHGVRNLVTNPDLLSPIQ